MSRRWVVGCGLVAALAAGLLGGKREHPHADAPLAIPAPTYLAELQRISDTIESLRDGISRTPASWMAFEQLASAHLERARLTGDHDDYAAAESLIAGAFAIAPDGAGPFQLRAALSFTLHRLDAVEPDLAREANRVVLDDPARAAIEGLRGDVALQRGRLSEARQRFERALELHDDMTGRARLAQCLWLQGDFEGAAAGYRAAASLYHGASARPQAWSHLQIGLMELDRGRLDRAMAHYVDADRAMPGWWLVEEHIAEVQFERGQLDSAEARYTDLIARTGDPEFMDQIARIRFARGDEASGRTWVARAEAVHRQRMVRFPEASWGHALGHFLEFGSPSEALDLARRNHEIRPNAEAKALLAEAEQRAFATAMDSPSRGRTTTP